MNDRPQPPDHDDDPRAADIRRLANRVATLEYDCDKLRETQTRLYQVTENICKALANLANSVQTRN